MFKPSARGCFDFGTAKVEIFFYSTKLFSIFLLSGTNFTFHREFHPSETTDMKMPKTSL